MITPVVADMNHNNAVDFANLAANGIIGVVHKATQGLGFTDPAYDARRAAATAAGLKWGAYDFATGDKVADNVARFFAVAKPDANTLMCLDFEDNTRSQMSGAQAHEFLDRVDQKLGRACWIYGGNRIFEQITDNDPFWPKHPLWLCQYKTDPALRDTDLATLSKHIRVPPPWKTWTLLQYTADGVGPLPHTVPGVENGADLNAYAGTTDQLRAVWPGPSLAAAAPPTS
jgi:lysozyme